jgi:hypothetical protein
LASRATPRQWDEALSGEVRGLQPSTVGELEDGWQQTQCLTRRGEVPLAPAIRNTCTASIPSHPMRSDPLGWTGGTSNAMDTEILNQSLSSRLYNYGIDAHIGSCTPAPRHLESDSTNTMITEQPYRFQTRSLFQPKGTPGMIYGPDAGSSHSQGNTTHNEKTFNEGGAMLNHLQPSIHVPFRDSMSMQTRPTTSFQTHSYLEDFPPSGHRKLSSKEILEDILARAPATPRTSRAGTSVVGMSAGARSSASSVQMACSEDNTPHICVDEEITP